MQFFDLRRALVLGDWLAANELAGGE